MARKAPRATGGNSATVAHPANDREARSRIEVTFDDQTGLGRLFGEFDANLVQIENRLGVYIGARGNKVIIEGAHDSVGRARDVLGRCTKSCSLAKKWTQARSRR